MKRELVISTVFSNLSQTKILAERCYTSTGIRSTIVCQLFEIAEQPFPNEYTTAYDIIYSTEKGLAKSRMLGVLSSSADLIWIADDDIEVVPDGAIEAFSLLEASDDDFITTKYAINETDERKRYSKLSFRHTTLSIMKVSSIEIMLKKPNVLDMGICFDTRFGLGAKYKSGEENIFLADILSRGGKGKYLPITTSIHRELTSGGDFSNSLTNLSKGAIFKRVFGWWGLVILFAFYIKKLLKKEIKVLQFFSCLVVSLKGFFQLK
ncbi:hypothetical protein [Pseudoalteromonas sp. bablab_jr011]|uniref:hypothetical protein n=1 Tax=Pseudoalteromonas sp. bablab_jr011 TaxID=2755062 RepID=UPI0018F74506|nr:hypothetical protein [Pseudoalteromonas sp. bablab_jr011]